MDKFKPGDYKAICDICGFQYYASELRDSGQYPGLKVCHEDYDPRHPQERVRGIADDQTVPWSRDRPAPVAVGKINPEDL